MATELLQTSLYFMEADTAIAAGVSPRTCDKLAFPVLFTDSPRPPTDLITVLPRLWFDASLDALRKTDFLCAPTLRALQVICIIPMVRSF
jgi:hypothetical protein